MDWHLTFDVHGPNRVKDQAGQSMGWTGYTWDTTLFPDHVEFLKWCHDRGLKTVLNLHPASGIQPWESSYPAFARAMGVDPASKKYIPFDLVNKKSSENYFNLVLHPLEREGVDFWWIDWQQWDTTSIPNLGPTWWLNYAFYTDMAREKKVRPLILARWGGLGDHRYQIGFSGDVISDWSSLQFQPYFTSTAANVGFGYWSHDIGGHIPGAVAPELYTRWVQWGALSPILRTHTTKNPEAERRIWAFPYQYFRAMRNAFTLRQELLPYIYTSSRKTYDSGISMIHPLYYEYPDQDQAYDFGDEYFFGDDLLVSPVVHPMSSDSLLATERIWIPPGTWIEWSSSERLNGPQVMERHYSLEEIPIFVRSGSILPMQFSSASKDKVDASPLILRIYPDSSGSNRFYQDEGNSDGYQNGQFAWTLISYKIEKHNILKIAINPTEGQFPGMEQERSYEIQIVNTLPPARVFCAGTELHFAKKGLGWSYDGDELSTIVRTAAYGVQKPIDVSIEFSKPIDSQQLEGIRGKIVRLREAMDLLNSAGHLGRCPELLVKAAQTGNRLSLFPETAENQVREFRMELPMLHDVIQNLPGNKEVIRNVLNHLCDVFRN
jgi:alpha-glucosidase